MGPGSLEAGLGLQQTGVQLLQKGTFFCPLVVGMGAPPQVRCALLANSFRWLTWTPTRLLSTNVHSLSLVPGKLPGAEYGLSKHLLNQI